MPAKNTLPATMRAIAIEGGRYRLIETKLPTPGRGEVLVKVAYSGMNRADVFQLENKYPLPEAEPKIPGIEFSGIVAQVNAHSPFRPGDRVCGVVREGTHAEYCLSPGSTLLPVPKRVSLKEAACLPEAILTAWISLFHQARLKKGEKVLIHGGASGVGVMAIQMAKLVGATVFATAGTPEKCGLCQTLGAAKSIHYRQEDFVETLQAEGVDVILDMVGGDYFQKNLSLLNTYGRLAMISFLRGAKTEVNLAPILLKKLSVYGSLLRNRPVREKGVFVRAIHRRIWPYVDKGRIRVVIDSEYGLEDAQKAIQRMEQSLNSGKIVLRVSPL